MIIRLTGIIEDGSTPDESLPDDTRRAIRITKGQSVMLELEVKARSGVLVDLSGGSIAMSIKRKTSDGQNLVSLTATLGQPKGTASISITPANTKPLEPGFYVYDIWYTSAGGDREPLVAASRLFLAPTSLAVP